MKRNIIAGLSILGGVAGVGWKLASHPDTSARLQEISLSQRSEHSTAGAVSELGRVRVRVMAGDVGDQIGPTADKVPQISLAAE